MNYALVVEKQTVNRTLTLFHNCHTSFCHGEFAVSIEMIVH